MSIDGAGNADAPLLTVGAPKIIYPKSFIPLLDLPEDTT